MNLINLKRMYNHVLLNVSEKNLGMTCYRTSSYKSHECESTGCVIGHCVIIDDYKNIPLDYKGNIDFTDWSEKFTGIKCSSFIWAWLFGCNWPSNKEQILLRFKYLIEYQKHPDNWSTPGSGCYYTYILPKQKLIPYELN